jgi:uncharacterized protein YukE
MGTIHMEIEQVRAIARQLDQWAASLLSNGDSLKSTSSSISIAWQGGHSDDYQRKLGSLLKNYNSQIQEIHNLVCRLSREVEEWDQADSNGTGAWNNFGKNIPAIMTAGLTPIVLNQTQGIFDWYKPGSEILKRGLDLLKKMPYDSEVHQSWEGIGRILNNFVGNQKAGWVGGMNKLGHIIRSPVVSKGVPYGLGVVGDLLDGNRWDRAFGSEAIEGVADWGMPIVIGGAIGGVVGGVLGLGAGGVGAIPGAVAGAAAGAKIGVAVYGVYQGVIAAGHIFSGALQVGGYGSQGLWLQNNLESLDFGEKIGDGLYDAIYNFATK